jgi:tetratricopeptide (TPR) repeat protein
VVLGLGLVACVSPGKTSNPSNAAAERTEGQQGSVVRRVDAQLEDGWGKLEQADYPSARKLAEQALAEASEGGFELGAADASMLLGRIAHRMAAYDEALEHYRNALAIYERVLGPEYPEAASTYNDMGVALHSKGEYAEALGYLRKALAIHERVFGNEHPVTATTRANIAGLCEKHPHACSSP